MDARGDIVIVDALPDDDLSRVRKKPLKNTHNIFLY